MTNIGGYLCQRSISRAQMHVPHQLRQYLKSLYFGKLSIESGLFYELRDICSTLNNSRSKLIEFRNCTDNYNVAEIKGKSPDPE